MQQDKAGASVIKLTSVLQTHPSEALLNETALPIDPCRFCQEEGLAILKGWRRKKGLTTSGFLFLLPLPHFFIHVATIHSKNRS